MATQNKTGTIKCSVKNFKTFKKYKELKHSLTSIGHADLPAFSLKLPDHRSPDRFYYGVRIVTGHQDEASTTTKIYLELIGEKGRSGRIGIGNFIKFAKSSEATFDDYLIKCHGNLGEVHLVTIGIDEIRVGGNHASWYVDFTYVINMDTECQQNFPCYHWLGNGDYFTIASFSATLKQLVNYPLLINNRAAQIAERQKIYVWEIFADTGVPSGIDISKDSHAPLDEKFEKAKGQNFTQNFSKSGLSGVEGQIIISIEKKISQILGYKVNDDMTLDHLHDFFIIAHKMVQEGLKSGSEKLVDRNIHAFDTSRWTSDVEFGRLMLNGVNCVIIQRCSVLPSNFPVTSDHVKHFLGHGLTFEQEMENGNVYICDLSEIMDGIKCREGNYVAAPLCLLYVNTLKQLLPIAIQLKRIPGADNPIFYPSDNRVDWILAKMFYANASAQHHQLSTHYLTCHAAMEAYGVATMRNLPDAHPVYKLLRPHFRYTMAINIAARKKLINDGGLIDKLFSIGGDDANSGKNEVIRRAARKYNVHWSNIKRNLAERGVDDPDKLPNYFFRDDGIRIWDAIETYVKSILNIFYDNDQDVQEDTELDFWVKDVHNNGFPAFHEAPSGRGFPNAIKSKSELVEYCTLIIFTATVQHSAVNFGQFQMFGFVPNSPLCMRHPPPTEKGVQSKNHILECLPDASTTGLSIALTWTLSQYSPDEIFLGGYPTMWYTEDEAKECVKAFHSALEAINADIVERNKKLDVPYEYLLSTHCPNSITI